MPTKIDIALAIGKEDLAASIEKVNAGDELQELSSLFQDEVQRHEMRYLDTFLSSKNSGDGSSVAKSKNSRESLYSGHESGRTVSCGYESRIAQLMGSTVDRDSPAAIWTKSDEQQSTNNSIDREEKKSGCQEENNIQTHKSISCEQYDVSSTIKALPIGTSRHNKRSGKRPTPSRNRRRQLNHRFLQKAKLKSHQIATKMIRFASRCTRNASNLSHLIRGSVSSAAKMVHKMLEENKRRANHVNTANISGKGRSFSSQVRVNVPPSTVFFTPKWASVKLVKEQTKSFIAKSVSNSKHMT